MKNNSETLVSENGLEVLVAYEYNETPGYYEEAGNPGTWIEPSIDDTKLTSVEFVIKGRGIQLLHLLTEKEKQYLIDQLTYEE